MPLAALSISLVGVLVILAIVALVIFIVKR